MLYTVLPGDTLSKIAAKFGVPISSLILLNHLQNPDDLLIGLQLKIPNLQDVPEDALFASPTPIVELIKRAKSMVGGSIDYKLGKGGLSATSMSPSQNGYCDCSGFVCWVLGLSRQTTIPFYKNLGGWIYTDSIEADMKSTAGIFDRLAEPAPGCIVVYGAKDKIGHVGMVSEVAGGKMKKVIHCSSGNARKYNHHSIQETLPTVFTRPDVLFGYFVG